MHEHQECQHEFKYCAKCDTVYCEKCQKEWGADNGTITYTYPPYLACSTGGSGVNTISSPIICNHS